MRIIFWKATVNELASAYSDIRQAGGPSSPDVWWTPFQMRVPHPSRFLRRVGTTDLNRIKFEPEPFRKERERVGTLFRDGIDTKRNTAHWPAFPFPRES